MYRIQRLLASTVQKVPRESGLSRLPGIVAILLVTLCLSTDMTPVKAQAPLPQPPAPPSAPDLPPASPPMPSSIAPPPPQAGVLDEGVKLPMRPASAATGGKWQGPVTIYSGNDLQIRTASSVIVEVTIDQNGEVSDARVISGPLGQRRAALLAALGMRFPVLRSTTRQIEIPANPAIPANGVFYRAPNSDALQNQLKLLLYQQSIASEKGAAQLQEKIDSLRAAALDQQTRNAQPQNSQGSDPGASFAGQPLGDIRILGVNDFERDQLLAKIPLFIRHPLTRESIAAALQAIHEFDSNATAYFSPMGFGEVALIVRIP